MAAPVKCRRCEQPVVKTVTEAWVDVKETNLEQTAYMPGRTFLICQNGCVTQALGDEHDRQVGERYLEQSGQVEYEMPEMRSLMEDRKESIGEIDNRRVAQSAFNGHPDFVFKRHILLRNQYDNRLWIVWDKDGTRWVLREVQEPADDGTVMPEQGVPMLVREEKELRNTQRWLWERN